MAWVVNINQCLFYLFAISTIFYWSGWISKKTVVTGKQTKKSNIKEDQQYKTGLILSIVVCFLIGFGIMAFDSPNSVAGISAALSLADGSAAKYHQENLAREALYHDPLVTDVQVLPFSVKPHVLFFDDIEVDPLAWQNVALAAYYHKNSVVLLPYPPQNK